MNINTDSVNISELCRIARLISQATDDDNFDEIQKQVDAFDKLAGSILFSAQDKEVLTQLIEIIESSKKQAESRQLEIGKLLKSLSTPL